MRIRPLLFFVLACFVLSGCGGRSLKSTISSTPSAPVAGFTFSPVSPTAAQSATFTDTSTGGATTWNWDFGDSSGKNSLQNPVYDYLTAGTYTVTLTVGNAIGSQTVSHNVVVASMARYRAITTPKLNS